ncbi:LysE family translocator [Rhizobium oryzicola]|uniref:LysE family transporter n=1 Tax=Rhizobium oryzicola TaxID=1232668 RepID=A0ABT8T3I5_9HYPH|nr:LysE family transporter [Rhizobium oryzicola]MDO1585300.1 LysE family transporter [Rhizobium oryzicola]
MDAFVSAWILGLSIAIPFGPVSLMCLEHSLSQGIRCGLASGAGAATTHGIYATLAMIGANSVAASLVSHQALIHTLSGTVFLLIGVRTILRRGVAEARVNVTGGRLSVYLRGMALALANPMTILPYIAFGGSVALSDTARSAEHILSIMGICLGTLSWYWVMSSSAWLFRQRLPETLLTRLNLMSGAMFIVMGISTAVRV